MEYGNSSPRVWIRITILLLTLEGGMTFSLSTEYEFTQFNNVGMGLLHAIWRGIRILSSLFLYKNAPFYDVLKEND